MSSNSWNDAIPWFLSLLILFMADLSQRAYSSMMKPCYFCWPHRNMSWEEANHAGLWPIIDKNCLDHHLGMAFNIQHITLEADNVANSNMNAADWMLCTLSSSGRGMQANNLSIANHLGLDRREKTFHNNPPEQSSELCWLSKVRLGVYERALLIVENTPRGVCLPLYEGSRTLRPTPT